MKGTPSHLKERKKDQTGILPVVLLEGRTPRASASPCWAAAAALAALLLVLLSALGFQGSLNFTPTALISPNRIAAPQPQIEPTPDTIWPNTSSHRCVGTPRVNQTCQLSNVVYDTRTKEFIYYTSQGATRVNEVRDLRFFEGCVKLRVRQAALPPRRDKDGDEVEPSLLYNMLVPASFAHMSRDTFAVVSANLHDLGLSRVPHRLVVVRAIIGDGGWYKAKGMRMLRKYAAWLGGDANYLEELARESPQGSILFRHLVVSTLVMEVASRFRPGDPAVNHWGGCGGPYLKIHRDDVYAMAGVPLPPVSQHATVRVLFHDKLASDQRRILNIPELVAALAPRYPQVEFVSKVVSLLTPRQQLLELSAATIFVSPHGSSSWRMLYLADGAHAIIVGASEIDGFSVGHAHGELGMCWDSVDYLKIHRYHVTDKSEFEDSPNVVLAEGFDPVEYVWWRTDKRLKVDKLAALVDESLRALGRA